MTNRPGGESTLAASWIRRVMNRWERSVPYFRTAASSSPAVSAPRPDVIREKHPNVLAITGPQAYEASWPPCRQRRRAMIPTSTCCRRKASSSRRGTAPISKISEGCSNRCTLPSSGFARRSCFEAGGRRAVPGRRNSPRQAWRYRHLAGYQRLRHRHQVPDGMAIAVRAKSLDLSGGTRQARGMGAHAVYPTRTSPTSFR